MATALNGRLVRASNKDPLIGVTVEAIDVATGVADGSDTTDSQGFYEITGLTAADTYFAKPLVPGDDWVIQPDTNNIWTNNINATGGTIGGWTIGSSSLTGGDATLASAGKLTLGTSNDVVNIDAGDATYRLAIGHATYGSAPFRVTKAGALTATSATITGSVTATSGTIGGWTVDSDSIDSTGISLRSSGTEANIALGATPPTSETVGTGIYMSKDGVFGLNANTQEFYLRASDGKGVFGAGNVVLSSSGIAVAAGSSLSVTGAYSGASTLNNIDIQTELTGTGSLRGLVSSVEHTASNAATAAAIVAGADHDSTATLSFLYGVQASASIANTGNVSSARGVFAQVNNTGDLTSDARGVYGNVSGNGVYTDAYAGYFDAAPTGTATTVRGVYATASGGTNNRGVEIAGPSASANNYAIYSSAAAKSYLAGALEVDGLISADGGITVSAHASTTIPAIIIPASVDTAGDGTTSGTTELTVREVTITNPTAAGQIFIVATVSLRGASVAADTFQVRLYFGTTPTQLSISLFTVHATDMRGTITLHGTAAVAASGTQLIRTTVQRSAGTGTIIAAAGQCEVSWIIVPGAGTTA